jgi:hypothetical protein
MPDAPFLSTAFGETAKKLLAKAGTVALPYPPPASGKLYIGINPDVLALDPKTGSPTGSPRYFLRLVQEVIANYVVTRILSLDSLCGVSLPPSGPGKAGREFFTVEGIGNQLKAAIEALNQAMAAKPGMHELLLFEDVVIYVKEAASVHLRLEYEFGVTAAEAAENVELRAIASGCCKPIPPTNLDA